MPSPGIVELGLELRQRLEHEAALVQARVRHAQARLVDDLVPVHEQVEVDRPGPPALAVAHATQLALGVEQDVEQLARETMWSPARRRRSGTGLVDDAHGLRLPQLGELEELDSPCGSEQVDRPQDRHLLRAEVGAEADVRARHRSVRSAITAACSTGGSRTTSGLRMRTRTRSTVSKRSRMPSTTAPASASSSWRSGPGEDLAHELGEVPVVHGVVDVVARRGRVVDVHPEIDQEALAEPPLRLEIPVMPEQDQPSELDRHAITFPLSTAAATASASTVSRTSWTRSIHAPRS